MLLAKQGVDVNQARDDGCTPLFMASQEGHSEVVSMLLAKQGVDVNQAMNDGRTPLYIASHEGHSEVVSMLLTKQCINMNQAWSRNAHELVTPLRAAIDQSHTEIAKLLVMRGSILVDAPMGAHGVQLNLVLGAFAQAIKADYDALCAFRLCCLVRAYHEEPQTAEGGPAPAQRRRVAVQRMSQNGSFAMPRIESFLLPCHADPFKPDLTVRRTLNIILGISAAHPHQPSTSNSYA